ncbi:MAG: GNAT family N-acetyltransferase [Alphaproteobacteria bacterium]|nr:GNAT family N-acetyltransferase [Alphaproteobacteria bacterium]
MAADIDPALVEAWLTARSIARGLPLPVPDHGGWRVDTSSDKEIRRWVFPQMADGLRELADDIVEARYFLKLCGLAEQLIAAVPPRWKLQPAGYLMTATASWCGPVASPEPYRLQVERQGVVTRVVATAADGSIAASGNAAETADAFVYDRIETDPAYRRRGLARCVMAALAAEKKSRSTQEILVATEEGQKLYARLGWHVCSPYSTVTIPLQPVP